MNNNRGIAPIVIILIIIGVLALGGGIFYYKEQKKTESLKNELDNLAQQEKQKEQKGDLSNYSAGDIEDPNFRGIGINEDDPTKNWETYRNEKNGVEFRYPFSWIQLKGTGTKDNIFPVFGPDDHNPVFIWSAYKSLVEDKLLKGICEDTCVSNKIFSAGNILGREIRRCAADCYVVILISHNGNVYEIHSPDLISYPDNKEMSEDAKIIKQILSTFKFID